MGWLTDWRRRRVLAEHRIDEALWPRLRGLPPARQQKLKDLALLFLAEKQFTGTHGLEVTDAMRVSIAAQACLPILELGLDWYSGWTGIVVYPGDFRVRRTEVDEDGVVHEWDDELAGEAMPGGPVVLSWDAAAHDPAMNVVHPRVRAQARHARTAWPTAAAAARRHGRPRLANGLRRGLRRASATRWSAASDTWLDPYARRASRGVLRRDQRGVLRGSGRNTAPLSRTSTTS